MQVDFNKRELKNFLKKAKKVGEGYHGICFEYNQDYLIKVYIDELYREDFRKMFNLINESKIQEEFHPRTYHNITPEEEIKNQMNRLAYTKYCYDLIKGPAFYDNYCFGTILTYYKGYKCFDDPYLALMRKDALEVLFNNINITLQDLMDNYIYPTDIKEDNILFDDNLNIKFIDLDDGCTVYLSGEDKTFENECKKRIKDLRDNIKR